MCALAYEEEELAKEGCQALDNYYACKANHEETEADYYGRKARENLDTLRESLGEHVYYSHKLGPTALINGRKVLFVLDNSKI